MNKKKLTMFIKKNLIILIDYSLNHRPILRFFGFVNKTILKGKIKSVFLVYPAKRRHITAYTYDWFSRKMKWKPFIIGFFVQKKKIGIVFTMSSGEKDFWDDGNKKNLELLIDRMEEKRKLFGAEIKSFAGILPGVFSSKGISKESKEASSTVLAIFRAIEALREELKMSQEFSIIVLGGKGFIGKKFISFLERKSEYQNRVFSIDLDNFDEMSEIMGKTKKGKVIVLNITKKKALNEYIPFFTNKTVILNEVYPEPSEEELEEIKQKGAECYHIVGLKGQVYPPFPGAYSEGVPCCASFISCEKNDIIIKKLT